MGRLRFGLRLKLALLTLVLLALPWAGTLYVNEVERFLLEGQELAMESGMMLVAPEGVPHGVRNTGSDRLVVLAVLAPAP